MSGIPQNMMTKKLEGQEEKYKIAVMAVLLGGACFLTYYFHLVLGTGRVFTHLFYIPIILASLWWQRKGLIVALFLGGFLIFSHIFLRAQVVAANDYPRAVMFVVVAFIIATLSEQITREKKKAERINKVLFAIRSVNQLIITEKGRARLIERACDFLIETRGYYRAWIALMDENRRFITAAQAGLGDSFSSVVEMMRQGDFTPCAQNALEQSGIVMVEDCASAHADCPLVETGASGAGMTIRLEHGPRVYGILCVYTSPETATDADEQLLFREVAGDIAYGLHGIELEEQRKTAEAKTEKERRYTADIVAMVPDSLVVVDKDLRIKMANRTFYETFQAEPAKATGSGLCDILHDEDGRLSSELTRIFGTEDMLENFELSYQSEKAGERVFNITARGIMHAEAAAAAELVVIRDRTKRKQAEDALQRLSEELEVKVEERTKELVEQHESLVEKLLLNS